MEASKFPAETVDMLPFVREQDDDERRRRGRRHLRFPGSSSTSSIVIAFIVAFFCAACLTITLRSAAQVSDLQQRLERLESDFKTGCHGKDLHGSSSSSVEEDDLDDDNDPNIDDEAIVKVDLEFGHRLKREAANGKKRKGPNTKTPGKGKVQSAIHLSLDVRNPTAAELQHHDGGDAFIYKAWKVSDWAKGEKDYQFDSSTGGVKIQRKGLYFIYSQILYHNSAARSSYMIMVDRENFVKCMESVDAVMPESQTSADSARYKTCYVGAARVLEKGQTVWIKDLYSRYVTPDSTANFFGLMKIADLEK